VASIQVDPQKYLVDQNPKLAVAIEISGIIQEPLDWAITKWGLGLAWRGEIRKRDFIRAMWEYNRGNLSDDTKELITNFFKAGLHKNVPFYDDAVPQVRKICREIGAENFYIISAIGVNAYGINAKGGLYSIDDDTSEFLTKSLGNRPFGEIFLTDIMSNNKGVEYQQLRQKYGADNVLIFDVSPQKYSIQAIYACCEFIPMKRPHRWNKTCKLGAAFDRAYAQWKSNNLQKSGKLK